MSFYNRVYAPHFKDTDDGKVFFPHTSFGAGYFVDAEMEEKAKKYLRISHGVLVGFLFVTLILGYQIAWLFLIVAWWIGGKSFVERNRLKVADVSMGFREAEMRNNAELDKFSIMSIFAVSIFFMIGGIVMPVYFLTLLQGKLSFKLVAIFGLLGFVLVAAGAVFFWKGYSAYKINRSKSN